MEDALRALQQQVNTLQNQTAPLDAEVRNQRSRAHGQQLLVGTITTVLNRAQAPHEESACRSEGPGEVSSVFRHTRMLRTSCQACFRTCVELWQSQRSLLLFPFVFHLWWFLCLPRFPMFSTFVPFFVMVLCMFFFLLVFLSCSLMFTLFISLPSFPPCFFFFFYSFCSPYCFSPFLVFYGFFLRSFFSF